MKKILVLLCAFMMMICLGACASSQSSQEPETISVETPEFGDEQMARSYPFDESLDPYDDYDQGLEDFEYGDITDLSFADFSFFEEIMYEGLPEDAYYPALKYAEGTWKYDLRIRYDSSDGFMFDELGYADLVLDREREVAVVTLHPRLATDGFEMWQESDEEVGYEPFEGGFDENGALKLIGNYCVMYIECYYAYEGREFILGTIWTSEEDFAYLLMVRGQE